MNLFRKFLFFFILTSILPLFVLGSFLYKESKTKLDERFRNLEMTAQMLVTERLEDDLDKLQLLNSQAALLTIGEDFQRYLNNGENLHLGEALNRFQQSRNLGIVALIDYKGKVIASTDTFEDAQKDSLNKLIALSIQGEAIQSTETLKLGESQESKLMYIAVSPIWNDGKVIGVLLIGQTIEENNSFHKLLNSLPILRVSLSSTKEPATSVIEGVTFKNNFIPIKSYSAKTIGYLKIGISQELESGFQSQNTIFIFSSLILALLAMLYAGYWFNRSFVLPLNMMAEACNKLSQGELKEPIPNEKARGEVRETINNFNNMVSQLNEKEVMKNNFISCLTHDLRTPLLAQRRVFELLQEFTSNLPPEFLKLVDGLHGNNEHLLRMVNSMVEIYQFDMGTITLEKEEHNLQALGEDCLSSLNPLIEVKKIEAQNLIPQNLNGYFDYAQMKRVFINILGNAIENIPENSQLIIKAEENDLNVNIEITDTGKGIATDDLPYIFERYFSRNKTKGKIGSGLGLYICKTIVESHGGIIKVASKSGEGTTFQIQLPK